MSVCGLRLHRAPGHSLFRSGRRARFRFIKAFTLIELLVVIAIIAILAAILFPVFSAARESGQKARCSVQLKQLAAAIIAYTDDNSGRYVPAARDIYTSNLHRWHGVRPASMSEFDSRLGPLWNYMAKSGGLKKCPAAPLVGLSAFNSAFESGCGGFGYNALYVGGTYYRNPAPEASELASNMGDIARPAKTVMLADTAMAMYKSSDKSRVLIEYSFAEPPYTFSAWAPGGMMTTASPSVHFRHSDCTNVAWCDGHVSSERMTRTNPGDNTYGCDNEAFKLGWFGPDDNSLFDNK